MRLCSKCGGNPKLVVKPYAPYGGHIKASLENEKIYQYQCKDCGFMTLSAMSHEKNPLFPDSEVITGSRAMEIAAGHWERQYTIEDMINDAKEQARQFQAQQSASGI